LVPLVALKPAAFLGKIRIEASVDPSIRTRLFALIWCR